MCFCNGPDYEKIAIRQINNKIPKFYAKQKSFNEEIDFNFTLNIKSISS